MAESVQRAQVFSFPEKGSRVLNTWLRERKMEQALAARSATAMRSSGFAGASVSRLTASLQTWSGAINADLDNALVILRARARGLAANYEFARRFLSLVKINVVGPDGPTLQVRAKGNDGKLDTIANDIIETAWAQWCGQCDLAGRVDFAHMLRMIIQHVARDGEIIVRIVRGRDLPNGIALQMLEPDRLAENINRRLDNGNMVRMGVEIDSRLRPVAYYLSSAHPGESYLPGAPNVERVPAADILHVYLPERAEQVRGYSWFHAVISRAGMLQGYEEAAIVAARVGAAKMGVFEKADDGSTTGLDAVADGKDAATGNLLMNAEPGEFLTLPDGYKLNTWNPEYPHANYADFINQCMRGMSAGLDVAAHNISGNMREVNYSSARIAELSERDMWRTVQGWFCGAFLMPVYRLWLQSALIRGEVALDNGKSLPAERYGKFAAASRFQSRTWSWVDPLKDVQTAREEVAEGLNSRTAIAASRGREFDDIVKELAMEEQMLKDAGIAINKMPVSGKLDAPTAQEPAP